MLRFAIALLVVCSLVAAATRSHADAPAPGTIDTTAGGGTQTGDGIPATSASLDAPIGVAVDAAGDVFFSDLTNCSVRKVTQGTITTAAGTGTCPSGQPADTGDGGPATNAVLRRPFGLALDSSGNVYIADEFDCAIRRVDALTNIITTVVGNGSCSGVPIPDGAPATSGLLWHPEAVAVDSSDSVLITQFEECRVRAVTAGVINTVAGNGACGSSAGDGGPAVDATLGTPSGIAVDTDGNLYVAEGCRIREVIAGMIDTVAGTGNCYFTDDGPALSTDISPFLLATDAAGNVYFADDMHCRIRRLKGGVVNTLAGRNYPPITVPFPDCGFSGDGGPALQAQLEDTVGVAVDDDGNVFFTELDENKAGQGHVRVVYHPLDAPATPTYTPTSTPSITPTPTYTPTPTSTPTATPTRVPSCADIDRSGTVTTADILYVVRHYRSADLTADLNSDGAVTTADIMMVLHQYGKAC